MAELTTELRNLVYNTYKQYDWHSLIRKLHENYSKMKQLIGKAIKSGYVVPTSPLMNERINEISGNVLFNFNYSKYVKPLVKETTQILTENDLNEFYYLYKFQERIYEMYEDTKYKELIENLSTLSFKLHNIKLYEGNNPKNIDKINDLILKSEYDDAIKPLCEEIKHTFNELDITFEHKHAFARRNEFSNGENFKTIISGITSMVIGLIQTFKSHDKHVEDATDMISGFETWSNENFK